MEIYEQFLAKYGYQGWWPVLGHKGANPTKTGSIRGYHPKDYDFPKNEGQKFEICAGAILAQNTNWVNVEKALLNLQNAGLIGNNNERLADTAIGEDEKALTCDAYKISKMDEKYLAGLIRPAGYYNQKAKKLKIFAKFYCSLAGRNPKREELLNLWGIGPETADSILLYAYKQPYFVADTYTKRVFVKMKLVEENWEYETIKSFFERNLPKDYRLCQEFHALIVEHAKRQKEIARKRTS